MKRSIKNFYGIYEKLSRRTFSATIGRAFGMLIPVFMIGACALTLRNFPAACVRDFFSDAAGGALGQMLDLIYNATYGFSSVYLVAAMSFSLCAARDAASEVSLTASLSSVACYFAFLGPDVYTDKKLFEYTKMSNLFSALLVALVATRLYFMLYRLFDRKRPGRTSFERVMHSVIPALVCITLFAAIAEFIYVVPSVSNFNDFMIIVLNKPFESISATFAGGMLIMLAESVLWLAGIHGGNVFDGILTSTDGAFAFSGGQIVTKEFCDTFVLMGGCGSAMCLFIALSLFSRSAKKKRLCRLAGVPLLFNINEIIVFGLPTVLNPIYALPFIAVPLVCFALAYAATAAGIVPQIINPAVHWTTPLIISGYQATGSVAGSVMQAVLLAVGTLIYIPFVLIDNKIGEKNEKKYLAALTDVCKACEKSSLPYSSAGADAALRSFEDEVAAALARDIDDGNITLYYQPEVCCGEIVAAEALLRFKYGSGGFVYPPLAVGIALRNGLFDRLSCEVVKKALTELAQIQRDKPKFKIAVNLRLELLANDGFRSWLINEVNSSGITRFTFGAELTEDTIMLSTYDYSELFADLKNAGIEVLMDDFSMGHTSIAVLQKSYFDYVKIDGSLIKDISNERSRSIISSVMHLGEELNFKVVAECVESAEQRDALAALGCEICQGYFFSKPVTEDRLKEMLSEHGK